MSDVSMSQDDFIYVFDDTPLPGEDDETTLIEYGIQKEKSRLRVHVCFDVGVVYIFPVKEAAEDCLSGKWDLKAVKVDGNLTATGWVAPVDEIRGCECIPIPGDILRRAYPPPGAGFSDMGRRAESVVNGMIGRQLFFVKFYGELVISKERQLDGVDFDVTAKFSLQVKCDKSGGGKQPLGTGNLFLQRKERNQNGYT